MTSQNMTSQNMTSQNMTLQNMTSQNMTLQNMTSQNMTLQNMTSQNPISNMFNSAIATTISEFITLPICTIRTNYINNNNCTDKKQKLSEIIKTNYQTHGIRWFFSAKYPAIIGQAFSTSSKYTLYKILPSYNPLNKYTSNKFIFDVSNSIGAGIITSSITHPLDYIKIQNQMNNINIDLKHIYRGYSKTLAKATIGGATFFPIYDWSKENISNPILGSAFSAILSTIIIQPFDYLKIRNIYGIKHFEFKNIFDGLGLNILRILPHFVITMNIIEYLNG
jgi:hypothetical protein